MEEDGRKWLRRPELCTKSCRAVLRRRIVVQNGPYILLGKCMVFQFSFGQENIFTEEMPFLLVNRENGWNP